MVFMARKSRLNARKQPLQKRSQVTVAVILEAAARILEERGLEGYNTNAIAERGGISVGSVYQYFPNKDALTLALIARFEAELSEAVQGAMSSSGGHPLRDRLRRLIRALLDVHAGRARLNRILETEEDRLRHLLPDTSADAGLKGLVAALLSRHRSEVGAPVDAAAIDDLIVIVRALVDAALHKQTSQAIAERRILRAVEGYLHWR
jgi:AcrR family transcriptional regulator